MVLPVPGTLPPMRIPLDQIDADVLPRDRTLIDAGALTELERSIAATGLRTPIEVYAFGDGYGLISGLRRLTAFRRLFETTQLEKFSTIEATLRTPAGPAQAMALMVAENDIRANLSAWERSAIAHRAVGTEGIETLDAAITTLFPHADRNKRARIRAIAEVVEALGHVLIDPEGLSQQRLLRISTAIKYGWADIVETALDQSRARDHRAQWDLIKPIVDEVETLAPSGRTNPHRPRRISRPAQGFTLRREKTATGYLLHITGRRATSALTAEIIDEIERVFLPE